MEGVVGDQSGINIGSSSSSSSPLPSSSSVPKVSNKNKRKLADTRDVPHDPGQTNAVCNLASPLTHEYFVLPPENFSSQEIPTAPSSSTPSSGSKQAVAAASDHDGEDEYEEGGWEDPMTYQLEELLMTNIRIVYQNAMKLINLDYGYNEDVVQKALSSRGFYCGSKDPVPNVVNFALEVLKKGKEARDHHVFDNLQQLINFTLVEMVGVVREVRLDLSVLEAMWALLLCDLNVRQACQDEEDMAKSSQTQKAPVSEPQPQVQPHPVQKPAVEEKPGGSQKANRSKKSQKHKGKGKGGSGKQGKQSTGGGLTVEKKSDLSSDQIKTSSSSNKSPADDDKKPVVNASLPPLPPSMTKTPPPPSAPPNFLAGIPYDESQRKYQPRDKKEEMIVKLVSRKQELQNELQGWNNWANHKVMQTTNKLKSDQAELRALRQEKADEVKFQREKQVMEESTMKRLSEMDLALKNANNQIQKANSTAAKLEIEQSMLKKEMVAAKSHASKSATALQEAKTNEKRRGKEVCSVDWERDSLQKELDNQRRQVAQLEKEYEIAKSRSKQAESRWKQEKVAKETLLEQAATIKKEREEIVAAGKAEEEKMKKQAETDMKKCMEDIKDLEKKVSQMKLKSEASKIAEMKKGMEGISGGSSKGSSGGAGSSKGGSHGSSSSKIPPDRECVMCLTEEKGVVFIPCCHQVLCSNCNELHQKQGMRECPTCRCSIMTRIHARYPPFGLF